MYYVEFSEVKEREWLWKVFKKIKNEVFPEFTSTNTYCRKDVARKAFRDRDIRIGGNRFAEV